jgi:hypothetical protein
LFPPETASKVKVGSADAEENPVIVICVAAGRVVSDARDTDIVFAALTIGEDCDMDFTLKSANILDVRIAINNNIRFVNFML